MSKMTREMEKLSEAWPEIEAVLAVPHTEEDYLAMRAVLDVVIDVVGEQEAHPWASLMETIGALIDTYENQHSVEPSGSPVAALKYLMDEHGLMQSDLPEIGSQGVVSEVLHGKRQMNIRQVKDLSRRFGVSPAVFI
jgi:HTH-type transcriptional regulator/antitoxin HigA